MTGLCCGAPRLHPHLVSISALFPLFLTLAHPPRMSDSFILFERSRSETSEIKRGRSCLISSSEDNVPFTHETQSYRYPLALALASAVRRLLSRRGLCLSPQSCPHSCQNRFRMCLQQASARPGAPPAPSPIHRLISEFRGLDLRHTRLRAAATAGQRWYLEAQKVGLTG